MQKDLREVRHFFYSQAFADGLRASLVILTPALLGYYIGYFDAGLTISIGAMAISLTDAPGPLIQRRNGMLYCACFAFIVVIITAFARGHTFTMALEIVVITFFFSMFTVYGNRATSVGNVAILVMILTMDVPLENSEVLPYAFRIFLGGSVFVPSACFWVPKAFAGKPRIGWQSSGKRLSWPVYIPAYPPSGQSMLPVFLPNMWHWHGNRAAIRRKWYTRPVKPM